MISWKVVGKGFINVMCMILCPFSWTLIISTFGEVLGVFPAILSFEILVLFSLWYFLSEGFAKEVL